MRVESGVVMRLHAVMLSGMLSSLSFGAGGCSEDKVGTGMPPVGTSAGASGTTSVSSTAGMTASTAGTGTTTSASAGTGSGTGGRGTTPATAGSSGSTAGTGTPPAAGAVATSGSGGSTSGTGGGGGSQPAPAGSGATAGASGGAAPSGNTCLKGDGDFSKAGPYSVKTQQVTIGSSGAFTLFVPEGMEANCHPMVAWGNGTTVSGGTAYRHFNERMATWGIVVAASHDSGEASSGPRIGDGSFHKAAIDYLLAENMKMGSQFFGKLNGKAGVSGHSQGGAGGDRASNHPAVKANGNVQGSFGSAPANVAFLCLTGTEDIATEGCLTAVNGTKAPAMYANFDGMSHTATLSARSAGTVQYARLLPAWFRCFLADDQKACEMFKGGETCAVCKESGWEKIFVANY